MNKKKNNLLISLVAAMVFIVSLFILMLPGEKNAKASGTQPIINLNIGDKVVDNSWKWEHRTGPEELDGVPYSGTGETKPVTWIVVAKNHYLGGIEGSVDEGEAHVTLITEGVIGKHIFDNSTNRGHGHYGSNHWGDSGSPNATHGIRKFLNGSSYSDDDGNIYPNNFYNAMNSRFQNAILETELTNKEWKYGTPYITTDKIFLPSSTELGDTTHRDTYPMGTKWSYYADSSYQREVEDRIYIRCWTRSPDSYAASIVRLVYPDGSNFFMMGNAREANHGVRPAINLSAATPVSLIPNEDGEYLLFEEGEGSYEDVVRTGDVTGTGNITVQDAIAVLRHIVGLELLVGDAKHRAKVTTGSGELTVQDAIQILRYIVGLINKFPFEDYHDPNDYIVMGPPKDVRTSSIGLVLGKPNTAGGVNWSVRFINISPKTIKYIYFIVEPYNAVGDVEKCTIRDHSISKGRVIGPIAPYENSDWRTFENAWYNFNIMNIKLVDEVEIIFMDDTSVVLEAKDIGYTYSSLPVHW